MVGLIDLGAVYQFKNYWAAYSLWKYKIVLPTATAIVKV